MSRTYRNTEEIDRRASGRCDRDFRRNRQAQRTTHPSDFETEQGQ